MTDTTTPAGGTAPDIENLKLAVEVWKKTVDVQQHFNEIEMKIRNLAVTLLVGVIGAAALALERQINMELFGRVVPLGAALLVGGFVGWVAFFAMEVYWYHVFLKAASVHAGKIETDYASSVPSLGLSNEISKASSEVKVLRIFPISSSWRLRLFYVAGALILAMMIYAVSTGRITAPREPEATTETAALVRATDALTRASEALIIAANSLAASTRNASAAAAQPAVNRGRPPGGSNRPAESSSGQ